MKRTIFRLAVLSLAVAGLLGLGGCAGIYRPTGVVLTHYSQDGVVPYAMTTRDVRLSACGTGRGLQQLVASFDRFIYRPSKTIMNSLLLSALCSQMKAFEAHLRYLRALDNGNVDAAKDAQTVSARFYRLTAQRRFQAYHELVNAFGSLDDGDCPELTEEVDAAQYLAGLLTSVQALLADVKANGVVGVPLNMPAKVADASHCLDNGQWWGLPLGIRATVWLSVPGATPKGRDPWQAMKKAVAMGRRAGMPLPATLYAVAAANEGATDKLKEAIRAFVSIMEKDSVPEEYGFLAAVGRMKVLQLSDEFWTKKTGHRTPYLELGTFPADKKQQQPSVNVDAFL